MPGPRGRAPTRSVVDAVEDLRRVVADLDLGERREGAVVELHDDALEGLERGRDSSRRELDRGVRAEQRTAGDAEQEAVADLPAAPVTATLTGVLLTVGTS